MSLAAKFAAQRRMAAAAAEPARKLPEPNRRNVEGATSVQFSSDGLALHALDFPGRDPAIVLVPGITSPAATWAFFVRALALPNRIIVLDCRGRGLSDTGDDHGLDAYARDLKALVDHCGLKAPVLAGHSMGARVVARFDRNWPGVASRLCLIDPPLSGPGRRPYPMPLQFYFDAMDALERGQDLAEMRQKSPGWDDERLLDRAAWLPSCDRAAVAGSHASFHEESFHDDWSRITANTALIYGGRSPVVQESDLPELRAARPDAHFIPVADAGHMIPWDNLAGAVTAVRQSLD